MLTTFHVCVDICINTFRVRKQVIEQKVIVMKDRWVTLSVIGGRMRVPRSDCFATAEEATQEAEERAAGLAEVLAAVIGDLKKPADIRKSPMLRSDRLTTRDDAPL